MPATRISRYAGRDPAQPTGTSRDPGGERPGATSDIDTGPGPGQSEVALPLAGRTGPNSGPRGAMERTLLSRLPPAPDFSRDSQS